MLNVLRPTNACRSRSFGSHCLSRNTKMMRSLLPRLSDRYRSAAHHAMRNSSLATITTTTATWSVSTTMTGSLKGCLSQNAPAVTSVAVMAPGSCSSTLTLDGSLHAPSTIIYSNRTTAFIRSVAKQSSWRMVSTLPTRMAWYVFVMATILTPSSTLSPTRPNVARRWPPMVSSRQAHGLSTIGVRHISPINTSPSYLPLTTYITTSSTLASYPQSSNHEKRYNK